MKTIRAKIPNKLHQQMEELVEKGWFRSQEDIIDEAIRRFLVANKPALLEKFIRDDVQWGLRERA
jgi:Arc/MetJ-type ribon-helix-helix transcriptional regulator